MPRRYRIELSRGAEKSLMALPGEVRARVASRIDALADDPRPPGAKKLSGTDDLLRVRVGDYRIVYQVGDRALIVLVLTIGHRREAYRRP